jgi:hypothetical protein
MYIQPFTIYNIKKSTLKAHWHHYAGNNAVKEISVTEVAKSNKHMPSA